MARSPGMVHGFTLIEVLVALGIVAIALAAGMKASGALLANASRQTDMLLAQLCTDSVLAGVRLSRQWPDVGEARSRCEQGAQAFDLTLAVTPTPNPNFRRVEASAQLGDSTLLRVTTVVGRY